MTDSMRGYLAPTLAYILLCCLMPSAYASPVLTEISPTSSSSPGINGTDNPATPFENRILNGIRAISVIEPVHRMWYVLADPGNTRGSVAAQYKQVTVALHYTDGPEGPRDPPPEGVAVTHIEIVTPEVWSYPDFMTWPPSAQEGSGLYDDWNYGSQGGDMTLDQALGSLRTRLRFSGPWLRVIMLRFKRIADPEHPPTGTTGQIYYAFLRTAQSGGREWVVLGTTSRRIHYIPADKIILPQPQAVVQVE